MVYAALLLRAICLPPCPAQAATPATGMNIANPMRANEAARTALIGAFLPRQSHRLRRLKAEIQTDPLPSPLVS
jgi:hypothetical protein